MKIKLSPGDVVRCRCERNKVLVPALVLGNEKHGTPSYAEGGGGPLALLNETTLLVKSFLHPHEVTRVKSRAIRKWKPLWKYGGNSRPQTESLQLSFLIAEQYLSDPQNFVFPSLYNEQAPSSERLEENVDEYERNARPKKGSKENVEDTRPKPNDNASPTVSPYQEETVPCRIMQEAESCSPVRAHFTVIPDISSLPETPAMNERSQAGITANSFYPSYSVTPGRSSSSSDALRRTPRSASYGWMAPGSASCRKPLTSSGRSHPSLHRTPAPCVSITGSENSDGFDTGKGGISVDKAPPFTRPHCDIDFGPFSAHLSPLYKIIYIDCSGITKGIHRAEKCEMNIPLQIFRYNIEPRRAVVMLTLVEPDSAKPVAWPKSRDFTLQVNKSAVIANPGTWSSMKKVSANELPNPRSLLYLFVDISQHVSTPTIQLTYQRKQSSFGPLQGQDVQPFRFAMLVLEISKISRFLSKIESLLAKQLWTDPHATNASPGNDDECEIVMDERVAILLKCPFSMQPIRIPVRGAHCTHHQVIDLSSFVSHIHQSRQWRCPLCKSEIDGIWDIVIDSGVYDLIQTITSAELTSAKALLSPNGVVELSEPSRNMTPLEEQRRNVKAEWQGEGDSVDEDTDLAASGDQFELSASSASVGENSFQDVYESALVID